MIDKERAKILIRDMGFGEVLQKILQAFEPTGSEDTIELINGLTKGLSATVAFEAYKHIEDHEGYGCAHSLIESILEDVEATIYHALDSHLEVNGRTSMRHGLEPSLNEQTRDEILKEMKDE